MAKLQEGYRVFEYKGKRFGVPEYMSDEEARASVEENFKAEKNGHGLHKNGPWTPKLSPKVLCKRLQRVPLLV